jgi:predicted site-specific integrase-resolvase
VAASKRLFKRKEAAELLSVSQNTVIRYVALGRLIETRIPSGRGHRSMPRYREDHIEAFRRSGYTR